MFTIISNSFLFCVISIAILIGSVSTQNECNSNVLGKNFVIGFTDNIGLAIPNIELHILLVSFNTEMTEVKFSSKFLLNDSTLFGEVVQLQPGGYKRVVIPSEFEIIGSVKNDKTIIIESDYKISVYAIHLEPYTTDGYLAIPVENLGNQYVVATYQSTTGLNTLFAIFATVDSTVVTVQLTTEVTYEGIDYFRGDTLTLELNQYEAVQIQSNATSFLDNDLTGSILDSNNPIAVISGHQCASSPGSTCDVILEQSIPVNSWGNTHFYSNPPHESDYSRFRVISYYNNTVVVLNGINTVVLGPGEVWEDDLYGNGIISSDKPTLLIQILIRINGSIVDPSLIQVPSENQFTQFLGFTTPTHSGASIDGFINFVNILVKSDERDTIRLNDQQIISNNNTLPSLVSETIITDSDYTLLIVELPRMEALYFITQEREDSSPMSAVVYGYERAETYGYAAGISLPSSERFVTIQPLFVRQLGGEIINIDLPCQTGTLITDLVRLKCKYGLFGVLMDGEVFESGEAICATLPTFQVGYVTLYVSLDNGVSFPFSGLVYIADEETILPPISIDNSASNGIIDFTSNEEIVLTWDQDISQISGGPLTLELILLSDPLSASPVWETNMELMTNVDNSGTLSTNLLDLLPSSSDTLTIGAFSLRQGLSYITSLIVILVFSDIPIDICSQFNDTLIQSPTGVQPCPCTLNIAGFDVNFEEDSKLINYFHEGSKHCYRSSTPTDAGSGQQCCYREDGNINLDQDGAGTADTFSPKHDIARHFIFDVLPWFACCKHSGQSDCETYRNYRPSDDCTDYVPPNNANTQGDPHFTTIDGLDYTFNGVGEFTIASSPIYNFTFQARMERYRDTSASVYTAFVIRTHNSSNIQLQRDILNQTLILIDDHSFQLTEGIILKRIARGVTLTIATDLSQVNVQFNNGVGLRVYIFPESMSFLLQLDESMRGRMEGLLGNFNGDTRDDLMLPNGSSIVSNSTLSQIHYQFGLEWMINENSSLFTYQTPFDYNTYSNPSFLPSFISPNLSEVSPAVRSLCGDSFPCLFDAVTTGMLSFANETLTFLTIVEEIQNNLVKIISCGYPGAVENGEFNGSVYFAGNVIRISCYDGFALSGADIIRCNDDGIWSDYLPVCRASENTTILIITIVLVALILLTCFILSLGIFLVLLLRNARE